LTTGHEAPDGGNHLASRDPNLGGFCHNNLSFEQNMAPQAKWLCSEEAHCNAASDGGLKSENG